MVAEPSVKAARKARAALDRTQTRQRPVAARTSQLGTREGAVGGTGAVGPANAVPPPRPVRLLAADPYAGLLQDEATEPKWYTRWWPWTIAGVVVVGAVAVFVSTRSSQSASAPGFDANVVVP